MSMLDEDKWNLASKLRKKKSFMRMNSADCDADPYISENFVATSKAISSFVPITLRKSLIDNLDNQKVAALRPFSASFHGICLLADISEFTQLSGIFCARGKDGLDDLQSATSGYMGSLVDTIYSCGGDVIKFAGDALVCVFKPSSSTQKSFQLSCAYALQCAWTLKDMSTPELSLHVAISCGEICVGQLGGFENRWECLISGSCLYQLSKCLDDAPKKQVAITPELYRILLKNQYPAVALKVEKKLSRNYLILSYSTDVYLPDITPETEFNTYFENSTLLSQTACYVPRPVIQALMVGSFNLLAELREVTTVFIKLDDYDHIEHEDLLSLQKFFYACQDILSDSGGFLRQFLVDDKGCVLIALWGVPTATFHDDCRRALGATVRIRCKLLDMKMRCSCGITSGIVYCGTVGNETRQEYAVVGDVVNLSARLMSKAHGEILLDEKTYSRLPEIIHKKLKKQPLMVVKGKDKAIVTYLFDTTHSVQADGRLGAALVDLSIDVELPIRPICKDALLGPLGHLSPASAVKDIQFLILEGRLGSGREEAAHWLRRHCSTKQLRVIPVRLSKADALTPHKALAKIFRLFIREENFDDPDRQTFVINNLLKLMYPKDIETREKVAYMAMKVALGVTCGLTSGIKRGKVSSNDFGRLDLERVTLHASSFCLSSRDTNQKQQPEITEKNAKIPLRHLSTILKDIFIFLFSEQPVVLLIEEAQDLDESSWKLIISLKKTQQKVFIVLMQEPIAYLNSLYSTAGSNSSIGALINPDSSIFYDWIEPYVNKLSNNKKYSYMLLPEFTFLEVRTSLANVLKVGVKDLPTGLDLMVYNLSGGNPYWFGEITSFLQVYGVSEFFATLGIQDQKHTPYKTIKTNTSNTDISQFYDYMQNTKSAIVNAFSIKSVATTPEPPENYTESFNYASMDLSRSMSGSAHGDNRKDSGNTGIDSKDCFKYTVNSIGPMEIATNTTGDYKNSHSQVSQSHLSSKHPRGSSSKLYNVLGNVQSGAKLEILIVCRFAKLSVDEQRIARTASIIGTSFASDVLNNILPKQLRAYLPTILDSLVRSHWLNISSEQRAEGIRVQYSFSHPLLHRTLYDLTPSSVKCKVHLLIAKYIESIHVEEKLYFMSLGYHYSRSGDDPRKTYEYLTRAAFEMVVSHHGNLDEGITLIQTAAANISSARDAMALLGVISRALHRLKSEHSRGVPSILDKSNIHKDSIGSNSSRGTTPHDTSSSSSKERKIKLKDLESSLEKIKINYEMKEIEFLKSNGFDEDGDKKDRNGRRSLRITKDELSILNKRYLGDRSDRNTENLFAANSGSENSVQSSTSSCRFGEKDNANSDFDADSINGKSEKNDHENEHENDIDNENEKTSKSFSEKFARNNRYKFQDSSEMSEERDKSPRTHGTTSRVAMIEAILKNYNYYEEDDLISNVGQPDYMAPNQHIRNERKTWENEIPSSNKGQNESGIWSMKSYSNSNSNSNSSSNSNRNSSSNRSNTRDTVIGSFAWQIPLIKIRSTYLLQKALSHRYHRRKPSESYTSHYNSNNSNKSNYNSNSSNHNNSYNNSYNSNHNNNNSSNNNNNSSVNPWSILEGSSSESHDKVGQNDPLDNVINEGVKEVKHTDSQSNPLRILASTIKIPSAVCTVS